MSIATGQAITAADVKGLLKSFSVQYMRSADTIDHVSSDVFAYATGAVTTFALHVPGSNYQRRNYASDWASATNINGVIIEGSYVYLLFSNNPFTEQRVYRYSKTNLAAGGTLMTISGQAFGTTTKAHFFSDHNGTFYFTAKAGGSASLHILSKYTLSGTTLTYVADVTCGSTSSNFQNILGVDSGGNIYGFSQAVDQKIRKYNSTGTLQATSDTYTLSGTTYDMAGLYFLYDSTPTLYTQIDLPS